MVKLTCSDYGFDCDFEADGDIESTIAQFGHHSYEEHGIDYSKEALMQFVLRKEDS